MMPKDQVFSPTESGSAAQLSDDPGPTSDLLLLSLHHEALLKAALLVLEVDVELAEGPNLGALARVGPGPDHRRRSRPAPILGTQGDNYRSCTVNKKQNQRNGHSNNGKKDVVVF